MLLKSLLGVFNAGFRRFQGALNLKRLFLPLSNDIGLTAGAEEFLTCLKGTVNRDIEIRLKSF